MHKLEEDFSILKSQHLIGLSLIICDGHKIREDITLEATMTFSSASA